MAEERPPGGDTPRSIRDTQPIDLAAGGWLQAALAGDKIRVVVTRAHGFSLALDTDADEAEAAARELLRAAAELRVGQENVPSRMHRYDYEIETNGPDSVIYVYETTMLNAPTPDLPRRRGLEANGRQSLAQLRPWVRAWLDGWKAGSVVVRRADGSEESEAIS